MSRLSRSARLRKYETVYNSYVKKTENKPKIIRKSPKKLSKNIKKVSMVKEVESKKNRKSLTKYQKYVRKESKKTKYKNMLPRERLCSIAKTWNDKNKK